MQIRQDLELFDLITEHYSEPSSLKFSKMTESEKIEVGRSLIDRIYVNIAEKYNNIDFGSIPSSNGKITKMDEYKNLKESIDLLSNLAKESRQTIPEIEVLEKSLANMTNLEDKFYMGFVKKNAGVAMLYNTLTMSLYCATSLMISVMVDYVNLANTDTVEVIIKRKYSKSNSYLMVDALKKFNDQVRNRTFDKTITYMMKNPDAPIQESTVPNWLVLPALALVGVVAVFKIIPLIKELIYLFYFTRMKLSDAASIQAELINANIKTLQRNEPNTQNKTIRIQKWFADKLTKISNAFAFAYEKGEKKAEIESKDKITPSDIVLF